MIKSSTKINKQKLTIIILSVLLLLAIGFGVTMAFYSDLTRSTDSELSFGTIRINDLTNNAISFTADGGNATALPGSEIEFSGRIQNVGSGDAVMAYQLTGDTQYLGNNLASAGFTRIIGKNNGSGDEVVYYVRNSIIKGTDNESSLVNRTINIGITSTIPFGDVPNNELQGAAMNIGIKVIAIQSSGLNNADHGISVNGTTGEITFSAVTGNDKLITLLNSAVAYTE